MLDQYLSTFVRVYIVKFYIRDVLLFLLRLVSLAPVQYDEHGDLAAGDICLILIDQVEESLAYLKQQVRP